MWGLRSGTLGLLGCRAPPVLPVSGPEAWLGRHASLLLVVHWPEHVHGYAPGPGWVGTDDLLRGHQAVLTRPITCHPSPPSSLPLGLRRCPGPTLWPGGGVVPEKQGGLGRVGAVGVPGGGGQPHWPQVGEGRILGGGRPGSWAGAAPTRDPSPSRPPQEAARSHQQQAAHLPGEIPAQAEAAVQGAARAQDQVLRHVARGPRGLGADRGHRLAAARSPSLPALGTPVHGSGSPCAGSFLRLCRVSVRPSVLPSAPLPCLSEAPLGRPCPPAGPAQARLSGSTRSF